ncbi:DUF1648 domain-containing protein [Indiicoccus explosivorum]|uniref:DUF1648 domain-containing protein n=1 Tax=Indiicoccus explosivorum TaxID=1917864 RepID=UPI000B444161|nr:DUF1648 domain-containing protein [Indiicoccus explosivorum]
MFDAPERPKLTIPKTKSEWLWDAVGFSLYFGSLVLLATVWNQLPDEVPVHFNSLGEVDEWGAKYHLLIFPAIGASFIVLMGFFERHPELHNYPARLDGSNAGEFYLISRKLMNQVKNVSLVIFAVILLESVSIAFGWSEGFGVWLLPALLTGTFLPIVIGVVKMRKIK